MAQRQAMALSAAMDAQGSTSLMPVIKAGEQYRALPYCDAAQATGFAPPSPGSGPTDASGTAPGLALRLPRSSKRCSTA
ncbi:hypothetical protein GCM10028812_33870 [Ancylobacter sonchi]